MGAGNCGSPPPRRTRGRATAPDRVPAPAARGCKRDFFTAPHAHDTHTPVCAHVSDTPCACTRAHIPHRPNHLAKNNRNKPPADPMRNGNAHLRAVWRPETTTQQPQIPPAPPCRRNCGSKRAFTQPCARMPCANAAPMRMNGRHCRHMPNAARAPRPHALRPNDTRPCATLARNGPYFEGDRSSSPA